MLGVKLIEDELDDDVIFEAENLDDSLRNPRLDRRQIDFRHVNLDKEWKISVCV